MGKMFSSVLFLGLILWGCNANDRSGHSYGKDSLAIREKFAESPVVTPQESLKKIQVENGFKVQLVVAEPLVSAPIALSFDERGRMWVVEMQGYMPDTSGNGENEPTGKIVILEDKNNDAVPDSRIVFLDSLVLPRAICFVEGGVLIAQPPGLWFVERNGDKAGKRTLIDDKYAEGGNAEHQANGLLHALDNWIYNANSTKRYRKKGSKWLIENTHFRGQWGITQDDFGRLFYNNNSANILGDYFSASLGATNRNQIKVPGFNEKIVPDNRVYPARPNTGVNRAYMKGVLDSSLRLVNFTAACGPLIYRGAIFGKDYQGNAFVAEPAANLIKRNILEEKGYAVTGKQAYKGKEFLASTDERFRPVSLYNGPDGALYIVDMYRGIIQHKTYLTEYLKNEIKERELTQPLSCGRIYRVVPSKQTTGKVNIPTDPMQLVTLLEQDNAWMREEAQQLIVDNGYKQTIPALRTMLRTGKTLAQLHAMWTLEGLDALKVEDVLPLLKQSDRHLSMQALTVMPLIMTRQNYAACITALSNVVQQKDSLLAPWIAFQVSAIKKFDKPAADQLLFTLLQIYPNNKFIAAALISSLQDEESAFLKKLAKVNADTNLVIRTQLNKVLLDMHNSMNAKNAKIIEKRYPLGVKVFQSICQTCHGKDGNGISSLAPPLNKSEWVVGDKNTLSAIVLFGLTGPVKINGKIYGAPEINGDMPGIGNNEKLSDEEIAQVLSFIRNSWGNKADDVNPETIRAVREKYTGREKNFTIDELNRKK